MDFTFTPEQDEAAALAARILGDRATPERMRAVEQAGDRFDRDLWAELGRAGLLALPLPERYDGAGLGLLEACRVAVEVGRRVAPVPFAAHTAACLALAEGGTDEQREAWLPGAARGATVLTAAVAEDRDHLPVAPATTAQRSGADWVVDGVKTTVPAGSGADLLLVSASGPEEPLVLLVRPDDDGVTVRSQRISDGDTVARVDLDGVRLPPERLLQPGGGLSRFHDLLLVTAAAHQLGVTEGALRLTAAYAGEREQFGRPIGTFQAVSQRLANGYIDTLGQWLTLWQAAWRLAEGLPASAEVATAKFWAADAGHRLAHTCVHVHGGVGIDLDGEAHRYFTAAKRFELVHGGATQHALAVGRSLAGPGGS